jgi:CRP-like cAMP-binding protein
MSSTGAVIERHKMHNAFEAPTEIVELLKSIGTRKTAPRKTLLFRKSDRGKGVFVLLIGKVALSAGNNQPALTRIASSRSILGLPSTVGNQRYSLTAEALTGVEVCQITPRKFRNVLKTNPAIGIAVLRILSEEVSDLRRIMG